MNNTFDTSDPRLPGDTVLYQASAAPMPRFRSIFTAVALLLTYEMQARVTAPHGRRTAPRPGCHTRP